jgi:hypothetical protein
MSRCLSLLSLMCCVFAGGLLAEEKKIDFTRDIRPILSNNCFHCHGPDPHDRQGGKNGLRLDTEAGALEDLGGHAAVVRNHPEKSALIQRITSTDADELMPPAKTGKKLTPHEIDLLTRWIKQGAPYAGHWSYTKPVRPAVPSVKNPAWCKNEVDRFLLARLESEGLAPAAAADKETLIRRVTLDLTGIPPTLAEVEAFVADNRADAYEQLVDRVLAKEAYGEHWARMWLDLARYADSAGYADDPPRTIWAYRDWVIQAFNRNQPFDAFSIEQLAGDLLPNPTPEQLTATAFHRNTLTNSEGGTNDEEYRNVAIVDRVNTTFAVWMGTSITCAQCHSHKYDPISQEEFFKIYAILNNTEDNDQRDERPLLEIFSADQKSLRTKLETEITQLQQDLTRVTPERETAQAKWEAHLTRELNWVPLKPQTAVSKSGTAIQVREDHSLFVEKGSVNDTYTITLPLPLEKLAAVRVEALPDDALPNKGPGHAKGNFVLTKVTAETAPASANQGPSARYIRVELPGKSKHLMLAEVQVFSQGENVAVKGTATQISTDYEGPAKLANDGKTDGHYFNGKSVSHTAVADNPWWEVDLGTSVPVERIVIWNRTDSNNPNQLLGAKLIALNEKRETAWTGEITAPLNPSGEFSTTGKRALKFTAAYADHAQPNFEAKNVLDNKNSGWAIGGKTGQASALSLIVDSAAALSGQQVLTLTLEHQAKLAQHTLGRFRIAVSDDPRAAEWVQLPSDITNILQMPANKRTPEQKQQISQYYLANLAPELQTTRDQLAKLKKQLADVKPVTVPILRELPEKNRRVTKLQHRGNFLDLGAEITPGTPAAFPPLGSDRPERLALAKWLVSEENPLTARVVTNRFWEQIFGIGLVRTSEEFGSQGELPSHPELLDYLATEFVRNGWNMKQFLKLLVTSAAYRQSSKVTPELQERDPENRLLARGPRFRLSAETIRDQALAISGLMSPKMFGPSVRPPRPNMGLSAAFGGGLDWQTSSGEDKYRRGLYTEWRRTSPYPSMTTFDAPNREVCSLRRNRTNTPLQALVTLNDPVYVEAAQAFARRIAAHSGNTREKITFAFRTSLARSPNEKELARLEALYQDSKTEFTIHAGSAKELAEQPLGPVPAGADIPDLAAWTVVSNVILNLDELFMKR